MKSSSSVRRVLGWLLIVIALFYLGRSAYGLASSLDAYAVFPAGYALVASWLVSFLWVVAMVASWVWMLRYHAAEGLRLPGVRILTRAYLQSFLSRYVPGKVWPAIVLVERLTPEVKPAEAMRSYFLQQIHLIASAAVLAVGVVPFLAASVATRPSPLPVVAVIGATCAAGLCWALFPRPIFSVVRRILPLPEKWRTHLVFRGHVLHWGLGFGLSLLVGILQGAAMIPLWQSIAPIGQELDLTGMLGVICAYAAARVVGQAAAVVPAGIGVREGAFVALVSGLSTEVALISVLWLRLLATSAELVAWLLANLRARA